MSAEGLRPKGNRLFLKKSVAQIQKEAAKSELKRSLGPINLMSLGIGAIIGAGIFVLTGQVAADYAGPAIMLSFVAAGIAVALAGLCYAELAGRFPEAAGAAAYVRHGFARPWLSLATGLALALAIVVATASIASGAVQAIRADPAVREAYLGEDG